MMANVQLLGFKCTSFIALDLLPTPVKPAIPRPRPPETTPNTPLNLLHPFHGPPSGPLPNPPCTPLRTLPQNLSPESLWSTSRPPPAPCPYLPPLPHPDVTDFTFQKNLGRTFFSLCLFSPFQSGLLFPRRPPLRLPASLGPIVPFQTHFVGPPSYRGPISGGTLL